MAFFYTKEELEKISLSYGSYLDYLSFLLKESSKLLKKLENEKSKYKRFIYFGEEMNVLTITNLEHFKFVNSNNQNFFLFFSGLLENLHNLKNILELFLIGKALFIKGVKELNFLIPNEMKSLEMEIEKFLKLVPSVYINKHYNIAYSYNNVDLELREEFFILKRINIKKEEEKTKINNFLDFFNLKGLIIKGSGFRVMNLKNNKFLIELGKKEVLVDSEIKIVDLE